MQSPEQGPWTANDREGGALERLLRGALRDVLARAGADVPDDPELGRRMVEVVQTLEFDEAELTLLRAERPADPDAERERVDHWIQLRLQRTLHATIERVAAEAGIATPSVPRVVVARAPRTGGAAAWNDVRGESILAESLAPLDRAACTRAIGAAEDDVLVIADAAGIDRILERHRDLLIDGKNVRLRVSPAFDDRRQTIGLAPEPGADGVEVYEASTVLGALDVVHERALRELGARADAAPTPVLEEPKPVKEREDLSGRILGGKYKLENRIGTGGFGSVYRARDLRLDHCVAIKILDRGGRTLEALAALREEARRLTRIDHPNIVDWKTFDESEDGTGYIVMELLEGEDLEEIVRREKRLPADRVAHVLHEIAQALCAAHTLGDGGSILHLDLKPRNVFVLASTDARGRDRVKVIDFGIAQHGGSHAAGGAASAASEFDDDLVASDGGTVRSLRVAARPVGGGSSRATACTPEYAAPEHVAHLLPDLEALPLDGRADVYSLGVIGYQLLTGELPFARTVKRRRDLPRVKTTTPAEPVASLGVAVPRDLARFVDRCLEVDREKRYADAEAACEALRRITGRTNARRWLIAAAATAVLAAGVVWRAWPAPSSPTIGAFVAAADGEHSIAGERLCFGPSRSETVLRIEDAESSAPATRARIVASQDPGAAEVEGTRVEVAGRDGVRVRVDAALGSVARGAFLEIVRSDGTRRHSDAFSLLYVEAGALSIESAGFDGLDGRALDPRGARLDVRVSGRSDLVERVDVVHDGRRHAARSGDGDGAWTIDPSAFLRADGRTELVVEVFDVAGGVRRRPLRFDVAATDVAWDVESDALRFGDRWSLTPHTRASARFTATRRADVAWRAVTDAGRVIALGRTPGATRLDLDLGRIAAAADGASFDGFLEFGVDESAYVLHARDGGESMRRFPIQFRAEATAVRAWVAPCEGRPEIALEDGATAYASCRDVEFRVARACEQPVRFEIAVTPLDARAPRVAPIRGDLLDRVRASEVVAFAWPADGAYSVRVRAWSAESSVSRPTEAPDEERTTTVVVQSAPSRLAVAGPENLVVRGDTDAIPRVEVRVDGAVATIAPISARWSLYGPSAREVANGTLPNELVAGRAASLALPLPKGSGDDDLDGAWRVEVAGTDAAGHEATTAAFAFHVARAGPRAELVLPLATAAWDRGATGFELRVAARDANGVARATCRLRRVGADDAEIACALELDGYSALGSLWLGRVDLPLSWSRARVEMAIECEDGYGLRSITRAERDLAAIDADLPPRIRVVHGGRRVAPMRLVRGNRDGVYVYGGRGDDLENELFRRAALNPFNALQTSRSWRVELRPGAVADFYLDEHEVTVAEYAEFVRDARGYADERNWAAGGAPDEARRRELLDATLRNGPEMPMTDVSWAEASAYARWAGKELPSTVEWEYALRGGAAYRPYSSWRADRPTERPEHFATKRLHPVGELDDVTSDSAIRDLSGNVSEWTSTPAIGGAATAIAPNAASLAADERAWVVGGSWKSARRDFSTLDRRRADARAPDIGFRCKTSASTFLARLEDHDEPRFESSP